MRPPPGRFVVEHALPGRLRLRLPRDTQLEGVITALGGRAGVIAATASPLTGGVLVRYDPERVNADGLLDVVAASASLEPLPSNGTAPASQGTFAEAVTSAGAALDTRVKRATRNVLGLATLTAIGLVLWAAAEVTRGRARPLTWSSALWYAHGLLRDYHREAPPPASAPAP